MAVTKQALYRRGILHGKHRYAIDKATRYNRRMNLSQIRTLLIDGDGVLWRLSDPMPGLNHFFDVVNMLGIQWGLLTNNSTRTLSEYADKLNKFGVETRPEQIFSSASVTAHYLHDQFDSGTNFYVIGADGLKQTLRDSGFAVYDDGAMPDAAIAGVVVGLDIDISYHKLAVATMLLRNGAAFVATNPDRTFPAPQGILPGAGSLVAALEAASDRIPEVIGKPSGTIFETAMKALGGETGSTAMIGDRMETDILGAKQLGLGTILVLTGVTTRAMLDSFDYQPDLILDDIGVVAEQLVQAHQTP